LVTDSLIIGEACDTAVFVIKQRTTNKKAAKEAIRLLRESNIPIAGIVLSNTAKRIRRVSKYYSYKYKYTPKK
jgi:Mrp family chromosome partitioning ATPase